MNDNSLDRIPEINGELLMIYGKQDPHVPQAGRDLIYRRLTEGGVYFTWHEFNAEHAFLRAEGHRYKAALAQIGYAMTLELFQRKLYAGEQVAVKVGSEARHCTRAKRADAREHTCRRRCRTRSVCSGSAAGLTCSVTSRDGGSSARAARRLMVAAMPRCVSRTHD